MGGVWSFLITPKVAAVDVDEVAVAVVVDVDEVAVGIQIVMNVVNLVILPESVDYALGLVV